MRTYAVYAEHTPGKPWDCCEFIRREDAEHFAAGLEHPYWIEELEMAPEELHPQFYGMIETPAGADTYRTVHNPDTGEAWRQEDSGEWTLLRARYEARDLAEEALNK